MTDKRVTHLDAQGQAHMVDVGAKPVTSRRAEARAQIRLRPETLDQVLTHGLPKGDVFAVARVAAIMAAKRTAELIPLCHPVALTQVEVAFATWRDADSGLIDIIATARTADRTGVEMEAMVAASIAALTLYDMCKSVDREMVIGEIYLAEKEGGKSGHFVHAKRQSDAADL